MKNLILIFLYLIFFTGCATLDVYYDFDQEANFALIKKYDWISTPEKTFENELTLKHIKLAVNRQLEAKGLIQTDKNPDILIALHGGKEKKVDVQEWGYAYRDRDYYHVGPYPFGHVPYPYGKDTIDYRRGTDTYEYEVGTIIIDFVDAKKKELIWRGVASGVMNPGMNFDDINKIIVKILEQYPPKEKK